MCSEVEAVLQINQTNNNSGNVTNVAVQAQVGVTGVMWIDAELRRMYWPCPRFDRLCTAEEAIRLFAGSMFTHVEGGTIACGPSKMPCPVWVFLEVDAVLHRYTPIDSVGLSLSALKEAWPELDGR